MPFCNRCKKPIMNDGLCTPCGKVPVDPKDPFEWDPESDDLYPDDEVTQPR
jgi:hypothetical protein